MNTSKYRSNKELIEDGVLTQTAEFFTISSSTSNIPEIDKVYLNDLELPLGKSVEIEFAQLTTYKKGEEYPNATNKAPDYCDSTDCVAMRIEGGNINRHDWMPSSGSKSNNIESKGMFYWAKGGNHMNILLLITAGNSNNVLLQKKVVILYTIILRKY